MRYSPFVTRLHIIDKKRGSIPLTPNWAQADFMARVEREHNEGRPFRGIVLKARQIGISTITEALMFAASFVYPNNRGLVISHDQDSYEHLLGMSKHYWETFFARSLYTTEYSSRRELKWAETKSSLTTATAKNVGAGRSRTIQWLHASEVAFWPNPEVLLTGLRQSIPNEPGTFICLESTANGVGNYFHTQWEMAAAGDSEFIPIFYEWWKHPEYTAEVARLPQFLGHLDDEEQFLARYLTTQSLTKPEIDSRLVWRRFAIRDLCLNDVDKFHQEYPSSPEEAFVSTGRNVFPIDKVKRAYQPITGTRGFITLHGNHPAFSESLDGPATIYRYPSSDRDYGRYMVAGDPTHTTRGDFAVIQVINRRTMEQVCRVRIRIDPTNFAKELIAVARYYNDAIVVTETTGPGYATVGALMTLGYPHVWQARWADKTPGSIADQYGFQTNVQRKNWAIGALLNAFIEHSITIHDQITYQELVNYVTLDNGGYGPAAGKHGYDDCVMALAIAVLCHTTEPPLPPYGTSPNPFDWEQWRDSGEVQSAFNALIQ